MEWPPPYPDYPLPSQAVRLLVLQRFGRALQLRHPVRGLAARPCHCHPGAGSWGQRRHRAGSRSDCGAGPGGLRAEGRGCEIRGKHWGRRRQGGRPGTPLPAPPPPRRPALLAHRNPPSPPPCRRHRRRSPPPPPRRGPRLDSTLDGGGPSGSLADSSFVLWPGCPCTFSFFQPPPKNSGPAARCAGGAGCPRASRCAPASPPE